MRRMRYDGKVPAGGQDLLIGIQMKNTCYLTAIVFLVPLFIAGTAIAKTKDGKLIITTLDTKKNQIDAPIYLDGAMVGAGKVTRKLPPKKYNSSGTKQWMRQKGSYDSDAGNRITVDSTGNIYVTGYTMGLLEEDSSTAGGVLEDIFLGKLLPD